MNQYLYETNELIPQNKCEMCSLGHHEMCDRKDEDENGCIITVIPDNNDYGEPRSNGFCTCWICHGMFEKEARM